MHKILVHAQHSCACTTLLCMHWRGQGPRPGPKKKQPRVRPGAAAFLLGPSLSPWPLQCMHKSVVHAQECCACTRILCMHKNLGPKNKPLLLGRCVASGGLFFTGKRRLIGNPVVNPIGID